MTTIAVAASLLSPTVRYLLHAAWAEGEILAHRRRIVSVIADPGTPPELRTKLRLVTAARQYAADAIGLRVKGSFTMYTHLQHDTLVLVLAAAYPDRLEPVTWWFPIVGSVPYKGFFDRRAALAAAADLERRGFDAFLRPSPAFSTLGWFNDPVVSTTLEDDSLELANTVIHELTHNTFYASGQASFNESLANFVGSRGAEQFFRSRGDSAAAAEVARRWADEKTMGAFWGWLYDTLDSTFRAHPGDDRASRAVRIAARDSIYQAARDSLAGPVALRVRTISAAALAHARLDNAVLLARRVYWTNLDDFDAVYADSDHDLRRAVRALIETAQSRPDDPFGAVRALVARQAR